MLLPRAAAAAVLGLIAGLVVSFVAAAALRSGAPEAGLLWRAASPPTVAGWMFTGSHGVVLDIEAGAEVRSEPLRRLGERIGDVFGRDDPLDAARADARVRLASLTILGVAGTALAFGLRRTGAADPAAAALTAAVAGGLYGAGVGLVAALSRASVGFDGGIVSAGVDASVGAIPALAAGVAWGSLFAVVGALSTPAIAVMLDPAVRAVGAGVRSAAVSGGLSAAVLLVVLLLVRGTGGGGTPDAGLLLAGFVLLAPNAVAAAVILAHGAVMTLSFDAGPFAGWSSLSYGTTDLTWARWLFVVVPVVAGVAAGRAMRRRTSSMGASFLFGGVWGLCFGVLALLLRVEVASSFSLASIAPGGGARITPVLALAAGLVLGTGTSAIGMLSLRRTPQTSQLTGTGTMACPSCGATIPPGDRFCSSCGATIG